MDPFLERVLAAERSGELTLPSWNEKK